MVARELLAAAVGVVVSPTPHKAEPGLVVRVTLEIPPALVVSSTVVVEVAENKLGKVRMEERAPLGGGHDTPEVAVEDLAAERADHTAAAMVELDPHLVRLHIIGVAVAEVAAI